MDTSCHGGVSKELEAAWPPADLGLTSPRNAARYSSFKNKNARPPSGSLPSRVMRSPRRAQGDTHSVIAGPAVASSASVAERELREEVDRKRRERGIRRNHSASSVALRSEPLDAVSSMSPSYSPADSRPSSVNRSSSSRGGGIMMMTITAGDPPLTSASCAGLPVVNESRRQASVAEQALVQQRGHCQRDGATDSPLQFQGPRISHRHSMSVGLSLSVESQSSSGASPRLGLPPLSAARASTSFDERREGRDGGVVWGRRSGGDASLVLSAWSAMSDSAAHKEALPKLLSGRMELQGGGGADDTHEGSHSPTSEALPPPARRSITVGDSRSLRRRADVSDDENEDEEVTPGTRGLPPRSPVIRRQREKQQHVPRSQLGYAPAPRLSADRADAAAAAAAGATAAGASPGACVAGDPSRGGSLNGASAAGSGNRSSTRRAIRRGLSLHEGEFASVHADGGRGTDGGRAAMSSSSIALIGRTVSPGRAVTSTTAIARCRSRSSIPPLAVSSARSRAAEAVDRSDSRVIIQGCTVDRQVDRQAGNAAAHSRNLSNSSVVIRDVGKREEEEEDEGDEEEGYDDDEGESEVGSGGWMKERLEESGVQSGDATQARERRGGMMMKPVPLAVPPAVGLGPVGRSSPYRPAPLNSAPISPSPSSVLASLSFSAVASITCGAGGGSATPSNLAVLEPPVMSSTLPSDLSSLLDLLAGPSVHEQWSAAAKLQAMLFSDVVTPPSPAPSNPYSLNGSGGDADPYSPSLFPSPSASPPLSGLAEQVLAEGGIEALIEAIDMHGGVMVTALSDGSTTPAAAAACTTPPSSSVQAAGLIHWSLLETAASSLLLIALCCGYRASDAIVRGGGIPCIALLMARGSAGCRASAAGLVVALAAQQRHHLMLRAQGVIPTLLAVLRSPAESSQAWTTRRDAALALLALSGNARCRKDMVAGGAVELITSMLKEGWRAGGGDEEGRRDLLAGDASDAGNHVVVACTGCTQDGEHAGYINTSGGGSGGGGAADIPSASGVVGGRTATCQQQLLQGWRRERIAAFQAPSAATDLPCSKCQAVPLATVLAALRSNLIPPSGWFKNPL